MKDAEKPNMSQQSAISIEVMDTKNSETLASHVVAFRHLGINKELAIICMQILAQRKKDGDNFDYNKFIKEKLSEAPSTKMNEKDKNMLNSLFKMNFNKIS